MQRVSVSFQVCLKAFTSASMYIQWGYSIKTPHRKAQKNISILEHEQAIFRIFQNKKHHHLAQPTSTLKHDKQKPASTYTSELFPIQGSFNKLDYSCPQVLQVKTYCIWNSNKPFVLWHGLFAYQATSYQPMLSLGPLNHQKLKARFWSFTA